MAQLFGERLSAEQSKRLIKAFDDFSRARRGATVVGFIPAPVPALVITCELGQDSAFPEALSNVLALLELPPVSGLLGGTLGKPSLELLPPVKGARRARLRLQGPSRAASVPFPRSLGVSWEARDGVGYIVVSPDETLGLAPFAEPSRLAASAWLAKSQPAQAEHTALGVFADARLLGPAGPDAAPILLSFGKQADRVVVAVDIAASALPALARVFALDRSP
jgi:hypothetical protein